MKIKDILAIIEQHKAYFSNEEIEQAKDSKQ